MGIFHNCRDEKFQKYVSCHHRLHVIPQFSFAKKMMLPIYITIAELITRELLAMGLPTKISAWDKVRALTRRRGAFPGSIP